MVADSGCVDARMAPYFHFIVACCCLQPYLEVGIFGVISAG